MTKSSKFSGLKWKNKDLLVMSENSWINCDSLPTDLSVQTLNILKISKNDIKCSMNKNKDGTSRNLVYNTGIRRNLSFSYNVNYETQIVTNLDDEGSNLFLVKNEDPLERSAHSLEYLLDDKDFETEQTEDEEEFLKETGIESKKRDKFSSTKKIHPITKNTDQFQTEIDKNKIIQEKNHKKLSKTKNQMNQILDSRKKNEINQNDALNIKRMKISDAPTRIKKPKLGFQRNIFSKFRFIPTDELDQEEEEEIENHLFVKNPLREIRKSNSKRIYHDITGQPKKNVKIRIDLKIKKIKTVVKQKKPAKVEFVNNFFVKDDFDDDNDLIF